MSLVIYWPKNGHQCCQCAICRTEVVINPKGNRISVERDMKYHSPKITIQNPNPVPLQFNDPISIQKALALFPSTQTQNTVLFDR